MTSSLRHYGRVVALLALIAGMALLSVLFANPLGSGQQTTVVTTIYPLYVAAQNVLGDTHTITLENLTGSRAGCLHDYQLSPADRITLERAELLLMNGAGTEVFLADILPGLSATVVDTGAGVSLISGEGHAHAHEGESPHAHKDNSHIWVSPARHLRQVEAVTRAICALDPENAVAYGENGAAYSRRVAEIVAKTEELKTKLAGRPCVVLHESLVYLAEDLGLHRELSLSAGEESGLSAADLAKAQEAILHNPDTLLLYDSQYALRYTALDNLLPSAQVLSLDTAILGNGQPTDWLTAMEHNLNQLQQLTKE